jgi:predicted transcriptional regulator of viral defense system
MTQQAPTRSLSPKLAQIVLTLEEENKHILTIDAVEQFYGVSRSYARKIISDLVKHGWLVWAGKGMYQLLPAKTGIDPYPLADKFLIASQAFPNAFIAYGSAAEHHGLTTQLFQVVTMANTKLSGSKRILRTRVRLVKIQPNNFIGFSRWSGNPCVRFANVERTLIDAVDRPELVGGLSDLWHILQAAKAKIDCDKLLKILPSYKSKSLSKRVGFLLESFEYRVPVDALSELKRSTWSVKTHLFSPNLSGANSSSKYSSEWNLLVNSRWKYDSPDDFE